MGSKWEGILRWHTWNVWPECTAFELPPLEIDYGATTPFSVSACVITNAQRSSPEQALTEPTELGPPRWDGEVPGLHRVRNFILKAPEDTARAGVLPLGACGQGAAGAAPALAAA